MRPLTSRFALSLGLLLAVATAAGAEASRNAALGFTGDVYITHSGPCGELVTGCGQAAANPALALDVLQPGEDPVRLLVPSTEGPEAEGSPTVVYEDVSQSLFLVWESQFQPTLSQVNLLRLRDGKWSDLIEVSGNVAPLKGSPHLLITRDSYELPGAEGEMVSHPRTILHIAWWEQGADAEEVFYTPIVLQDGEYIGHNQVYNLSQLDPSPPPAAPVSLAPQLLRSPALEAGRNETSLVLGFVHPATQRFLTFEAEVVPGQITYLGDELRREVTASADLFAADTLGELADRIRAHFIEFGARLHPALLAYLADEVRAQILLADPADPGGVQALADRIRAHFIELGARLAGGRDLLDGSEDTADQILDIEPVGAAGGTETPVAGAISHAVRLELASGRPAPQVGPGPVGIYLSEDGLKALVSWQRPDAILYRETRGEEGWTTPRRLELDGTLDAEHAEELLRQRVREH